MYNYDPSKLKRAIVESFFHYRLLHGISIRQAAKMLGMRTHSALYYVEGRKKKPSSDLLQKMLVIMLEKRTE